MGSGSGVVCDITLNTTLTPEQRQRFQDPDVIRGLLRDSKTVAIVGLSSEPQKASYFVGSYLQHEGYRIIPVTPRVGTILGERSYPDLASVPVPIDIVDVFRPASESLAIAEQAITVKAKAIWFQLRINALAAAERATGAGLIAILDKCVKMEHGRFHGSLHWAGMNTEIISARKPRIGAGVVVA